MIEQVITGWDLKWGTATLNPPPSLCPVPARGREARKRNLSITSNPVSLLCAVWSMKDWLATFRTALRVGWMISICYSCALERRPLFLVVATSLREGRLQDSDRREVASTTTPFPPRDRQWRARNKRSGARSVRFCDLRDINWISEIPV